MKKISCSYAEIQVACACGHKFTCKSSYNKPVLIIDVCSHCHPYFNNEQKSVETKGRADSFRKKFGHLSIPQD